jgi:hypothetical protein
MREPRPLKLRPLKHTVRPLLADQRLAPRRRPALHVVRDSAPPPRLTLPGERRPWWDSAAFGLVLALGSIGLAVAISVISGWWAL